MLRGTSVLEIPFFICATELVLRKTEALCEGHLPCVVWTKLKSGGNTKKFPGFVR